LQESRINQPCRIGLGESERRSCAAIDDRALHLGHGIALGMALAREMLEQAGRRCQPALHSSAIVDVNLCCHDGGGVAHLLANIRQRCACL